MPNFWHMMPATLVSLLYSSFVIPSSLAAKINNFGSRPDSPGRRLEDDYQYDLSEYSVRFGKCQYVKTFDEEVAQDADSNTVFAVKHFVVFRLCPSDECDKCKSNYGEYVLEVDKYLQATAEAEQSSFENYCNQCKENCNNDGENADENDGGENGGESDGDECDECQEVCDKYENMQDNGYVDASNYVECQKAEIEGNDDDMELYIGPRCSSDGTRIFIDLFQDENCWEPYQSSDGQTVEDILGYQISYHFLKNAYSGESKDCISCKEDVNNEDERDEEDADNVNEMCEELYDASAKCESTHGISSGFIQTNRDEDDNENQVENEFAVCGFINALVWDSYTETGEINIFDEQDVIIRETTTVQKGALSFLALVAFSLAGYAAYLHRADRKSVV